MSTLPWTVPVLALKGREQTGIVRHSTEQRKLSNGYHSLQINGQEKAKPELAHLCFSIPQEKDTFNPRVRRYPHVYVLCMSTVFFDFGIHLHQCYSQVIKASATSSPGSLLEIQLHTPSTIPPSSPRTTPSQSLRVALKNVSPRMSLLSFNKLSRLRSREASGKKRSLKFEIYRSSQFPLQIYR